MNFGLTAGFLTDADTNGIDISDQVESFQLGLSYGIGYKLEINENFSLMFDAQGLVGLTDIAVDPNSSIQNAGSSINLGAVFKL